MGLYYRIVTTREGVTPDAVKAVPLGPGLQWRDDVLHFKGKEIAILSVIEDGSVEFEEEKDELTEEAYDFLGYVLEVTKTLSEAKAIVGFQVLTGGLGNRLPKIAKILERTLNKLQSEFSGLIQYDGDGWYGAKGKYICGEWPVDYKVPFNASRSTLLHLFLAILIITLFIIYIKVK